MENIVKIKKKKKKHKKKHFSNGFCYRIVALLEFKSLKFNGYTISSGQIKMGQADNVASISYFYQ